MGIENKQIIVDVITSSPVLIIGGMGYIGSALSVFLQDKGYQIECADLEWPSGSGSHLGYQLGYQMDYRDLNESDLQRYFAVIHLAGHSNVKACQMDPDGAFENNLVGFYYLLKKIQDQKLIYASSSSIYNGSGAFPAHEEWDHFSALNLYDYTKFSIDHLAQISDKDYYSLRFGTVTGLSPKLREDLMINCMVKSALEKRQVDIYCPSIHRPILGIQDLCRAVESILAGQDRRGIYNLASFNSTVVEIGTYIADLMEVPLYIHEGGTAYDFSIRTDKFQKHYSFEFKDCIETLVSSLVEHYQPSLFMEVA